MSGSQNGGNDQDDQRNDFEKLLADQLWDEYRILQDKIDKIAGFRFTIRGWAVTLVIASSIGAATSKLASNWILLCSIPFLVSFWIMEEAQLLNRKMFTERCTEIEHELWRIRRTLGGQYGRRFKNNPRIAVLQQNLAKSQLRLIVRASLWLESPGHYVFYIAQISVVLLVTLWLQYGSSASAQQPMYVIVQQSKKVFSDGTGHAVGQAKLPKLSDLGGRPASR